MVCALQDVPEVASGGYVTTKVIRLRDGRRLAHSEVSDPDGLPVFHQHGMPGSRLEHEAEPDLYRSLGVRVITPDRPGYGLSDPHLHRPILDWPSDIAELADSLGIRRFGITGLSGGGKLEPGAAFGQPGSGYFRSAAPQGPRPWAHGPP
jgi:pimeloyl-ACP methyl ester carboxylesterase